MKILSVVGARPQFVKAAPIVRALAKTGLDHVLVHTGQHYDYRMSEVFFSELALPAPTHHLEVGSGSHGPQTGTMMQRLEPVLSAESPDWVLVYGDTNSTMAAALTSAKIGLPIAHIEAGLRSFRKAMPEEINRIVTDHVSTVLFCPTITAVRNAQAEGFHRVANGGSLVDTEIVDVDACPTADTPIVVNSGDVMFDAIEYGSAIARERSAILQTLALKPRGYYLATIHRASNTDDIQTLSRLVNALGQLERPVIFPVHPRTASRLSAAGIAPARSLRLIDPVGYFDMLRLEESAAAILTDSGGVQKEAFYFRVPCLTLRDETEWVETVETGWNRLVGPNADDLVDCVTGLQPGAAAAAPYGAGRAAEIIVHWLEHLPAC